MSGKSTQCFWVRDVVINARQDGLSHIIKSLSEGTLQIEFEVLKKRKGAGNTDEQPYIGDYNIKVRSNGNCSTWVIGWVHVREFDIAV